MKKIIRTLAAVLTLLLPMFVTSCSDDNNTETSGQKALVTINPAALYEELGVKDRLLSNLEQGKATAIDSVLIYNETGLLVAKLGAATTTLQPLTIEAKDLPDGTYTFVVWQTAIANDDTYESPWTVTDEAQLATVNIMGTYTPLFYYQALGYDTKTVVVRNGAFETQLSPKSAGSMIEVKIDNLDEIPDYWGISLWTEQFQLNRGIRFNPALDENERYIQNTDSNEFNYLAIFPKELDSSYKFFTLSHGDDLLIEIWGELPNNEADPLYTLQHLHLGVGEQANLYLDIHSLDWQPPFFGTPEDYAAWKHDRDEGLLVADPLLDWGCSAADVERHIQAKQWWQVGDNTLKIWEDENNHYHNWYYVARYFTEQYLFETADGQNLCTVMCFNWNPALPYDAAKNWLNKLGYTFKDTALRLDDPDPYDRYLSADGKNVAYAASFYDEDEEGDCWCVVFEPAQ